MLPPLQILRNKYILPQILCKDKIKWKDNIKMARQSFLTGAVILMAANAVSKILGAVFKIPLTYILSEEGMAVYNTAFQVYIMFLSFIISGFPFAVSKTVAESTALGRYRRARKIVNLSAVCLSLIGLSGSVLLYLSAPYLAAAMKEEGAAMAIRVISPSVFFVALGTAYKSYFQGVSNMIPAALSQVAEAVVKLAAGFALALYCVKFGTLVTAAGAVGGVTIGELLATLMLIIGYLCAKKDRSDERESAGEIMKSLMSAAVPLLAVSVAGNALSMAETAVTRNSMLYSGLSEDDARFLYGAYTGYAQTVFHLPSGILATIGVSILPVIAGARARGDAARAKRVIELALRLTLTLSLPCAVVMYALPKELLNALFHNDASAIMLKTMAPFIIPLCFTMLMTSVLQSAGKIGAPFAVMVICSLIRLALCGYLVSVPGINIYGAIIAFGVSETIMAAAEYAVLKHYFSLRLRFVQTIVKPLFAAAAMAAVIYLLREPICGRFGHGFVSLGIVAAASCAAYFAALTLCGGADFTGMRKTIKTQ